MRRTLALALAVAMLLANVTVGAAAAPPYEHVWQVEGMYSGDLGSTARSVVTDEMKLALEGDEWTGAVSYADVLGIDDSGSIVSQTCSMTLTLSGTALEGGTALGGRFVGVAELTVREAASMAQATEASLLKAPGGQRMRYDVSGFWSATLAGQTATGELIFQSARPRVGGSGPVRDAAWFNRVNLSQPDDLGDPQTFTVQTRGAAASDTDAPAAGSGGSVRDFVGRGIRGEAAARQVAVSSAAAAAARALLKSAPAGATPLPAGSLAIDADVSGAFLDAKNRAAGLLDEEYRPVGPWVQGAIAGVDAIIAAVPRPDEISGDEGVARAERIARLIASHAKAGVPGAAVLLGDVQAVRSGADTATVALLRGWDAAVSAIAVPPAADAGLLLATEQAASAVADEPVAQSGPLAGAALAAADSPLAPRSSRVVTEFEPAPALDSTGTAGAALPDRVLALLRSATGSEPVTPAISWAGGSQTVAPERWLAYRRDDSRLFWLAGADGPVALWDTSLEGWAWRASAASLVDAEAVGRSLATWSPLPEPRLTPGD